MSTIAHIEKILTNFDLKLANYEVINIEEKKGWSARFLFLIVEKNNQFVLKGKSKEQLAGYKSDIVISDFLKTKGFDVRTSIKTLNGDYHYVEDDIYWDLKTYITGSVEEFADYTNTSVTSLAQCNITYIKASLNSSQLAELGLEYKDFLKNEDTIAGILKHKDVLKSVIGESPDTFAHWLHFARDEIGQILDKNTDSCIIHNDLNNKNILLDLTTMQVISFIDWDHGCISTPLKDILEPINMFYDFIPINYEDYKALYLSEIRKSYELRLSESELNLLQVYFYALNKWKYITFFANLITELGNTTQEQHIFEDQVKSQLAKLNNLAQRCNVL